VFLKIGDFYINQDHVESIVVDLDVVSIYTDSVERLNEPAWVFRGEKCQAIRDWLEYRAEVSVII